jgi:hypothetical protein
MNNDLRNALRFVAYIRAMGGDPVPSGHASYREWAMELQRQHERLRRCVSPDEAKKAKAAARDFIRRKGYRRAAEEVVPVQDAPPDFEQRPCDKPGFADHVTRSTSDESRSVISPKERRTLKRDEYLCRRKVRHPNYWTAVLHARRLGPEIRIYECCVCDGLHVGHDPNGEIAQHRANARKRLNAILKRVTALESERESLLRERISVCRALGMPLMMQGSLPFRYPRQNLIATIKSLVAAIRGR